MPASQSSLPIVIDTDPGIDDVVALALAARSPELDVVAVTTTYGNASLAATTRNARAVLELAGRADIAVRPGAEHPLVRELVTAPETHGPSGVGYAPVTEAPPVAAHPTVLLDVLAAAGRPVTLVTLGPLTNVAHALEADAELLRSRVSRHLGMFGNLHERGNTNRWADFNAWSDPEATRAVLQAGLPSVMVGLDVTHSMTLSGAEVERLAASADALTAWLGKALRFYVEFHCAQERLQGCVVNDVLPLGELLAPGLLTLAHLPLDVKLDDGEHRGHTVESPAGAITQVAVEVDVPTMRKLLGRVFTEEIHG
jgi:inosine-uridine nucleoside N-ribohydrolase